MNRIHIKRSIESLLFAYGDSLSLKDIKAVIDSQISITEYRSILEEMELEYKEEDRGFVILKMEDSYQLGTNPKYMNYLEKMFEPKKKKTLTQASVETLAIIAYKQPVTKTEIENIRGVKCDKAINTLLEAGLIEEGGRLKKIGNPIIYKTSEEFLKRFGLSTLKDMPPIEQFKEDNIIEENKEM